METQFGTSPHVDRLTISEAEAVTGVRKTHINRLLDDGHFDSLWTVDPSTGLRMLDPDFCVFVKFHEDSGRLLAPKARHKVWAMFVDVVRSSERSLVNAPSGAPPVPLSFVLDGALSVDMTSHCTHVSRGWKRLRRSKAEIACDAGVRGGIPVIAGTRIGAYEVADVVVRAGVDEALATYPSLDREKIDAAVVYASANPRIGRPTKAAKSPAGELRLKSVRKHSRKAS